MGQLLTRNGEPSRKTRVFQRPRGNSEKCDMLWPGPTAATARSTPSATAATRLPRTKAGKVSATTPRMDSSESTCTPTEAPGLMRFLRKWSATRRLTIL